MSQDVLAVDELEVQFSMGSNHFLAVRGISYHIKRGETVCIVGESGSGKSVSSLAVMGLLPKNGSVSKGTVQFNGRELTSLNKEAMRKIRGNEISMIFQEPMTALNPVFTIGYQLREPLRLHKKLKKQAATKAAINLLEKVGISQPEKRMKQYPHELSGGMRQRVMIAMALACEPKLLIADEPTTALDVTIQSQILDLINDLKKDFNTSVLMITHDMGVVAEIADRVMVMYSGEIVEEGDVRTLFNHPEHPYTKGLLASVPSIDDEDKELTAIQGSPPNLKDQILGCHFHNRCPFAVAKCAEKHPGFFGTSEHKVRCWLKERDHDGEELAFSNE